MCHMRCTKRLPIIQELATFLLLSVVMIAPARADEPLPKLRIRQTGVNALRIIEDDNGKPFFVAGWAPQNIVQMVPAEDIPAYFKARHEQGFNTAWVTIPGWGPGGQSDFDLTTQKDYAGNYLLLDRKTPNLAAANLNPKYVASVDHMVAAAHDQGIYLFFNIVNVGGGDVIWPKKDQAECTSWGKFWGDRYAKYTHVNIMLGNDWAPRPQVDWIAAGIKQSMPDRLFLLDEGFYNHDGGPGPADDKMPNPWWKYAAGSKWINLWGWYNYENWGNPDFCSVFQYSTWLMYTQMAKYNIPVAPTFCTETQYHILHDGPQEGGGVPDTTNIPDAHVLRRCLWSVPLGGGSGWGLMGNYDECFFDCRKVVDDPVYSRYSRFCNEFFVSRHWELLVPDYDHKFLVSQATDPTRLDPTYVSAALALDGSFGAVYFPGVKNQSNVLTIDMSKLGKGGGTSSARWLDPTSNTYAPAAEGPIANNGQRQFTTPGKNSVGATDWVLLLESSQSNP